MKVAISSIRTKDMKIARSELVKDLQAKGHEVFYLGQESSGAIHQDYKRYNVKFLSLPIDRVNTNPLKEVSTIYKTYRLLKKNNISSIIVYGIRTFPTIVIGARLASIKNITCIVNGSGRLFQLRGAKGVLVKVMSYPLLLLSLNQAKRVLIQNKDDMYLLKSKKLLTRSNYESINGSGVNLEKFNVAPLPREFTFSMISRLTESKGVNEYIKAAKALKLEFPYITFNLVGPLDADSNLNTIEIEKAGNDNTIKLIGSVDDVRPILKETTVFVLPSYYPEGVPRSILEAMATGRPIITTTSPGCKETVSEGVNGYKIEPKNAKELIEKMKKLICNKNLVQSMAIESRKKCEKDFNIEEVNKKIVDSIS